MTASQWLLDPIRGTTTLLKVVWLYSLLVGVVVEILAVVLLKAGVDAVVVSLLALVYATYVTFATYRCAMNCPWPPFGRLIRLCSAVSLASVPFIVYFLLTGDIAPIG